MWRAASEYFEWVEENPLWEDKVTSYQGLNTHEPVAKMRAMTISGLCIFLDITRPTWDAYKSRDDFSDITSRIEEIIRTQKFEGASADLLNPNIIARDLGLAEKQELEMRHSFADLTDEELDQELLNVLGEGIKA